jgi:predicted DNA binding CopG/RHH family protein
LDPEKNDSIFPEAWIPDARPKIKMRTFANWEEVPLFDSEAAESDFWLENRPDLRLMEAARSDSSEASESVTITLRIDPRMLARIKRLARSRYLNYQSMIKQWLSERMEQEIREK